MWFSCPSISDMLSPSVPTHGQIRKRLQARIDGKHLSQTDDHRVRLGGSLDAQKLPTVVICVVCDVKNWRATFHDATKGKHSTVRRLIKSPVHGHNT